MDSVYSGNSVCHYIAFPAPAGQDRRFSPYVVRTTANPLRHVPGRGKLREFHKGDEVKSEK